MIDTLNIKINIGGRELERNYTLADGQIPENMQENLQEMTDRLLDNTDAFDD